MTTRPTMLRTRHLAALVAALLFLCAESHAQFDVVITGRVVDPQGVGVAGVDIDVDNMGSGGDPDLMNDGTDAGGFFTTLVEEGGTFHFSFSPPPPPTTSLLVKTLPDVTVGVGTNNLGTITLAQGVDVRGKCVGPTGLPAGGVNFDLYDAGGNLLTIVGGGTNLFGNFRFAAPPGPVEWRMNTLGVISETLAPTVLQTTFFGAAMNFGNIVLPRGYHLTAKLLRPNGLPLAGTNVDVFDSLTGAEQYTPGDDSNGSGNVDVLVAAGVYDLHVCPAVGTGLVANGVQDVTVAANANVGTIQLQAGVLLFGTVRNTLGQPVQGVNIDIEDALGNDLILCGDSSNASGAYTLVVPTGTWTLEFKPSYALPLGAVIQGGFVINGNKANQVVLPDCPTHTPYGTGLAGKGGFVPALSASGGSARLGNPGFALEISGGLGKAQAAVVSGFETASTPFFGGTLLVGGPAAPGSQGSGLATTGIGLGSPANPTPLPLVLGTTMVRLGGTRGVAGSGSLTLPEPIANDPILLGFTRYVQVIVEDKGAVQGVALSNGIAIDYCE